MKTKYPYGTGGINRAANPTGDDFDRLLFCIGYISNSLGHHLVYDRSRNKNGKGCYAVETLSDASFAPEDCCKLIVVSGMAVYINGNLLTWLSKKQNDITRSTAAALINALAISEKRMIQVVYSIENLGIRVENTRFFDYNQAVVAFCQMKSLSHTRKLVDIKIKIINDRIPQDWYILELTSLALNIADMFSNDLSAANFGVIDNLLFMQQRGLGLDPENTLA